MRRIIKEFDGGPQWIHSTHLKESFYIYVLKTIQPWLLQYLKRQSSLYLYRFKTKWRPWPCQMDWNTHTHKYKKVFFVLFFSPHKTRYIQSSMAITSVHSSPFFWLCAVCVIDHIRNVACCWMQLRDTSSHTLVSSNVTRHSNRNRTFSQNCTCIGNCI